MFVRVTGIGLPVLCVCKSYGYWIANVVAVLRPQPCGSVEALALWWS